MQLGYVNIFTGFGFSHVMMAFFKPVFFPLTWHRFYWYNLSLLLSKHLKPDLRH
jgi:hypothetical protein